MLSSTATASPRPPASLQVLNYFWTTGGEPNQKHNTTDGVLNLPQSYKLLRIWVDYFIDGPSALRHPELKFKIPA